MIAQLALDIPMAPDDLLANAEVLDEMLATVFKRTQEAKRQKRASGLASRLKRSVRRR